MIANTQKLSTIYNIDTKEKCVDVLKKDYVFFEEGSGITSCRLNQLEESMESCLNFYIRDEDFAYNWLDGEERFEYLKECKEKVKELISNDWSVFLKDSMFEYRPYLWSSNLIFVLQENFFEEFGEPIREKYITPEIKKEMEYYG